MKMNVRYQLISHGITSKYFDNV